MLTTRVQWVPQGDVSNREHIGKVMRPSFVVCDVCPRTPRYGALLAGGRCSAHESTYDSQSSGQATCRSCQKDTRFWRQRGQNKHTNSRAALPDSPYTTWGAEAAPSSVTYLSKSILLF